MYAGEVKTFHYLILSQELEICIRLPSQMMCAFEGVRGFHACKCECLVGPCCVLEESAHTGAVGFLYLICGLGAGTFLEL